jgi:outer membrane lipoprotein-sorting protein
MSNDQLDFESFDRTDPQLEKVLQGIRDEPVPDFPDPSLVMPASSEKAAAEVSPGVDGTRHRRRLQRWLSIAGVAVAFFVMAFLVWPDSKQSAFAQMQAALQEVRSVSYSVLDYHANGNAWETKVWILEPGFSRSEQSKVGEGLVADGCQISDYSQNLRLHIDNKAKTATFYEVSPSEEMEMRRNRIIQKFRNVSENAIEDLGATTFEGKPAHAFLMSLGAGGRQFKVTVDVESNLPVQMDFEDAETGFREVFTNFVFDQKMDRSLFALEAPEGYAVKRIAMAEPPANSDLLVVSPKTGIGPVGFGAAADEIVDFLGEPSNRRAYKPVALPGSKQAPQGFEYLQYNSMGLEIGVNSEHGMTMIRCLSQLRSGPSVHDFGGRTAEGICLGSTIEEVVEVYGDPELNGQETLNYIRLGWTFSIMEGKVVSFEISEPTPEEIEIIVNDDGSFTQQIRRPRE